MIGRHRNFVLSSSLACALALSGGRALSAEHGLGFQISGFVSIDDPTEELFDVDSSLIPEVFYRMQINSHTVVVGLARKTWDQETETTHAELDVWSARGSYRYLAWRDRPTTLFFGGGIGVHAYDANADTPTVTDSESGFTIAAEVIVGVEFFERKRARFHLSVTYSAQILSDADLCCIATLSAIPPFDVDLSGFYATMGGSFLFGR
jgi:hypothetical protein